MEDGVEVIVFWVQVSLEMFRQSLEIKVSVGFEGIEGIQWEMIEFFICLIRIMGRGDVG